jgi:dTDP-4-dehydrorhamnose 3,5-epimerase-like enzyme
MSQDARACCGIGRSGPSWTAAGGIRTWVHSACFVVFYDDTFDSNTPSCLDNDPDIGYEWTDRQIAR